MAKGKSRQDQTPAIRVPAPTRRSYTDDERHFARIARALADWLCRGTGPLDYSSSGEFVTQIERVARSGEYNGCPNAPLTLTVVSDRLKLLCRSPSYKFEHLLDIDSLADWRQCRVDAECVLRECADEAEARFDAKHNSTNAVGSKTPAAERPSRHQDGPEETISIMDTNTLHASFLELDDRDAVLRSLVIYQPQPVREVDVSVLLGERLKHEQRHQNDTGTSIAVPAGRIALNLLYDGARDRARLLRLKLHGLARLAVSKLPATFHADLFGAPLSTLDPLVVWNVAVHILIGAKRIHSEPTDTVGFTIRHEFPLVGFPPDTCYSLVEHFGAASCQALDILAQTKSGSEGGMATVLAERPNHQQGVAGATPRGLDTSTRRQFELLAEQFSQASAEWPNLEHMLISWPATLPDPEPNRSPTGFGPAQMAPWVSVAVKNGIPTFYAIAGGFFCEYFTRPNDPTRNATLMIPRRWLGKGGRRDDPELSGDDMDAIHRFEVLSRHASNLHSQIQGEQETRPAWIETLHVLSALPWAKLAGYSPEYTIHSIPDVFFESANVLTRLSQGAVEPRGKSDKGDEVPTRPTWKFDTGELWFDGVVVKTFKNKSPRNPTIIVLNAFQEEDWPLRIDLPIDKGKSGETVKSLNARLRLIRFRGDGSGEGIKWARSPDAP